MTLWLGGSGSSDSCIKDNWVERNLSEQRRLSSVQNLTEARWSRWCPAGSVTTGQEHPAFAVWGVIGQPRHQLSIMELHQRLNWIRSRARWRPSACRRQFKRKWASEFWHTVKHQHSGAHPETSMTYCSKKWGSFICILYLSHEKKKLLMFTNQKGCEPERVSNVLQVATESERTTLFRPTSTCLTLNFRLCSFCFCS